MRKRDAGSQENSKKQNLRKKIRAAKVPGHRLQDQRVRRNHKRGDFIGMGDALKRQETELKIVRRKHGNKKIVILSSAIKHYCFRGRRLRKTPRATRGG